MGMPLRRRRFLQSAAALGLAGPAGLRTLAPARADEMKLSPDAVRFRPEIEPVVRWIEETPRERILDEAVDRLAAGLSYRDLLAGTFLAGIRDVKPRPVGFKFHAVLVINSAHMLGQSAAVGDRLLPLFWALDNFKGSQAQDVKEGDWTLGRVDEARLPKPDQAGAALSDAFDRWDAEAADVAVAALARSSGAAGAMEPFWLAAARDQRNIGHKAIFAAQAWRTLQAIGWEHAEPVLRSLAFGILDLQGDAKAAPVGPYDANRALAATLRADWRSGGAADPGATRSLLATLREATPEAASAEAAALINRGVSAGSIWDAVVLSGAEMLVRNPGIVAIHAVTSVNALHFIANATGDDATGRLALLQAVGWLPLFRDRAKPSGPAIDALEPDAPTSTGDEAVAEVFAAIGNGRRDDRAKAVAKALGYLERGGSTESIFAAGRRAIFAKGRDSHDYKYAAAAWEEFRLASDPKWHAPLAAATLANLPGPNTPESQLMRRAREAASRVHTRES